MQYDLEVRGVTKSFVSGGKKVFAVRDISFGIKKGEVFALLGSNGAGKTTIMNIIAGLVLPDKGSVSILGEPNTNLKIFDRINAISAESHFHWALRPLDILNFYSKVYGVEKETAKKRINELVEFFEIDKFVKIKYGQLSTGEKSRLAFAKALINDPELLLLDEPTIGLDPLVSVKVRELVKKINKNKKVTVLLTSHYMQEVELLADRVAFINQGRIVDTGRVQHVKQRHFSTYELFIRLKEVKNKQFLKELGFEIKNNTIFKQIKSTDSISSILSDIHKKEFLVEDIKIKKPTLEDYFIKLADKK